MALYGAFDQTKHLEELDTPLVAQDGVLTPATRKAREWIEYLLHPFAGTTNLNSFTKDTT